MYTDTNLMYYTRLREGANNQISGGKIGIKSLIGLKGKSMTPFENHLYLPFLPTPS